MFALQNGLYPIKLFFSTVAALLHISSNHPEYSNRTTSAIYSFIEQTIEKIRDSTCKNSRRSPHFVAPDAGPSSPECPHPIDAGTPWFLSCHNLKFYPQLLDAFPMGSSYHTSKSPLFPWHHRSPQQAYFGYCPAGEQRRGYSQLYSNTGRSLGSSRATFDWLFYGVLRFRD